MTTEAQAPAARRHRFPSMGSEIEIILVGNGPLEATEIFDLAEWLAEDWEATFSRFSPESELSRLNAAAGSLQPLPVSRRLFNAVAAAVDAAKRSGGLFDPTILPALTELGYDRTFSAIAPDGEAPRQPQPAPGVAAIALDPEHHTIGPAPGVAIDLGGIAKGMYADRLADLLADAWPGGVVSAGGDLRVWGIAPDGGLWQIGVEDPDDSARTLATISLTDAAVATSGTNRRSWRRGGHTVHHLIDPRTGLPAASGLRSVTVVAPTASDAEVAATALFISGGEANVARRLAGTFSLAILVGEDGEVREIRGADGDCGRAHPTRH